MKKAQITQHRNPVITVEICKLTQHQNLTQKASAGSYPRLGVNAEKLAKVFRLVEKELQDVFADFALSKDLDEDRGP